MHALLTEGEKEGGQMERSEGEWCEWGGETESAQLKMQYVFAQKQGRSIMQVPDTRGETCSSQG